MLQMVIQSNMSPEAIIEVWEVTADIFKKKKKFQLQNRP